MELRPRPDAIFAYNDMIAIGALQHVVEQGLKVPDDVAVVGFDDIAMCEVVTPNLTSVRIDRDLLGRTAVEALKSLADRRRRLRRATTSADVELVVRESS